jgi:hypothetical protein
VFIEGATGKLRRHQRRSLPVRFLCPAAAKAPVQPRYARAWPTHFRPVDASGGHRYRSRTEPNLEISLMNRAKAPLLAAWICLIAPAAACRNGEAPPDYPTNMGTPENPLPPPVMPSYNDQILNGRANLVPLTPPEELPPPPAPGEPSKAEDAEELAAPAGDDRAAIADLVDRYLAAFEDRDFETIATLYVEPQRRVLEAAAANSAALVKAVESLYSALEEINPQLHAQLSPMLEALARPNLDLDRLALRSETEASIPAPHGPGGEMRFEKHGNQWLVVDPNLPDDPDVVNRKLADMTQAVDRMTAIIRDTSLTLEQRAAQVMSAMMSMGQGTPPAEDGGS